MHFFAHSSTRSADFNSRRVLCCPHSNSSPHNFILDYVAGWLHSIDIVLPSVLTISSTSLDYCDCRQNWCAWLRLHVQKRRRRSDTPASSSWTKRRGDAIILYVDCTCTDWESAEFLRILWHGISLRTMYNMEMFTKLSRWHDKFPRPGVHEATANGPGPGKCMVEYCVVLLLLYLLKEAICSLVHQVRQ